VAETINVVLPRKGFGDQLAASLAEQGLDADVVEDDDRCELRVRYADDEAARLAGDVARAIETWLGENEMPLVLERSDGGCVVRPPAD
jgi:hypothetical protein